MEKNIICNKIEWLKKQRDGLIIGDYRNCLYNVYERLNSKCANSPDNTCVIDARSLTTCISEDDAIPPNAIIDYCNELECLGYIEYSYSEPIIIAKIIKDIDF